MKPARIHVFDGLRVATEHIEHLQDGIHSSLEDLRAVLGLGVVLQGLEVRPQGESGVEVQPGFAFDRHRNRVVLDEPQRVEVTFGSGQTRRFVCAKHERVEDGEVEGRPTLVWDSGSVLVNDTLPTADEDLVPLAAVVRADATAPSFHVVPLDELPPEPPAEQPPPEAPPAGEEQPPAPTDSGEPPAPEPAGEAEAPAEGEAPVGAEPSAETPAPAGEAEPPGESVPAEAPAAETPAPATNGAAATPPTPRLRQGVLELSPGGATGSPLAPLTEALRARLRDGGENNVRVVLSSAEVQPGFAVAGLTGETSLSAEVQSSGRPPWRAWATAHGEATFGQTAVAQFGLSTARSRWAAEGDGTDGTWAAPVLDEGSLARLPLSLVGPEAAGEPATAPAGEELALTVDAAAGPAGVTLACALVWRGGADEERIKALEIGTTGFSWNARIGWKAVGA